MVNLTKSVAILLLVLCSHALFSQWQTVHIGTGGTLVDGCFLDDNTGVVISSSGKVLKTVDKGMTWTEMASLSGTFTSLAKAGSDTLYAGGNFLYRSTDKGNTWSFVTGLGSAGITDLGFFDPKNGYMIVPHHYICTWNFEYIYYDDYKVYQTSDYGLTWQFAFSNIESTSRFQFINDSTVFVTGGVVYIIAHCGGPWYSACRRTTDRGATWYYAAQPDFGKSIFHFIDPLNGYFLRSWDKYNIYKTEDGGAYLTPYYTELPDSMAKQCLFFNPIDGYLLADHNLFVTSSNGLTWDSDHYSTYQLKYMFRGPSDLLFAVGGNGLILKKQVVESTYPDTIYRVTLDKSEISFGYVMSDSTKVENLTIKNTGNIALPLVISSTDHFKISFNGSTFVNTLSVDLQPFQNTVLQIRFAPLAEFSFTDTLVITSDSIETRRVLMQGTGYVGLMGTIAQDTLICSDTLNIGGDLTILNSAEVTICPGTYVKFLGDFRINVEGTLRAIGDSAANIRFGTADPDKGWDGIVIDNEDYNDTTHLRYCVTDKHCTFGTVRIENGIAVIDHCSISNPWMGGKAVKLMSGHSKAIITNSRFYGNDDYAILCDECDSSFVVNNDFFNNGMGVLSSTSTMLSIISNRFFNNEGLGIFGDKRMLIRDNQIYNNEGGIWVRDASTLRIVNNVIYNNASYSAGGIRIENIQEGCEILQNLIFNNSCNEGNGGGISIDSEEGSYLAAYIIANTLCNNQCTPGGSGSELAVTSADWKSLKVEVFNNIMYNISGPEKKAEIDPYNVVSYIGFNCINQDSIGGQNNINADPQFAFPTPAAGSTTNIGYYDWSLTGFSPCLNAGDLSQPVFDLTTDFAGQPRVFGIRPDIGAYEYQWPYGIGETSPAPTIRIYPNPTPGILNVWTSNPSPSLITIYNVFSQIVFEKLFTNRCTPDLRHLTPGIYLYSVSDGNGWLATGKIVKE